MASITQTDKQLLELVLNKLESEEVFEYMDENNLLEPDQLYFVVNNDERAIAEYDKDNNGIVDDSERLGGELPEFYASQEDLVELKEDVLKSGTVNVDFGDTIILNDAADNKPLYGLKLYGKTTQDGTPSPTNPVPLVSAGDSGELNMQVLGKNLCNDTPRSSRSMYGITFEPVADGGGTRVYGTSTNNYAQNSITSYNSLNLPKGDYKVQVFVNGNTGGGTVYWIVAVDGVNLKGVYSGDEYLLQIEDGKSYGIFAVVKEPGITVDCITHVMITLAEDGGEYEPYTAQTLTVQTPNGLRGVPVVSGGNYTDENGQQWLCDEMDYERGVYVQRIYKFTNFSLFNSSNGFSMYQAEASYTMMSGSIGAITSHLSMDNYMYNNLYDREHFWINSNLCRIWVEEGTDIANLMAMGALASPIETPLPAEEIAAYKALYTNKPVTIILNDSGAGLSVAYAPDNESAKALIDYIPRKTSDIENDSDFITTASVDDKIDKALDGYSNAVVTSNEGPNELDETTLLYIDFEAEPDTPYIDANFLLNGRALGENGEFTLDGSEIYMTVNGIEDEAAVVTLPQGFDFLLDKISQVESNFAGVTNNLGNTINEVQTKLEGNITTINDDIEEIETNITNLEDNKVNRNGDSSLSGDYYLNGSINVIGEVKILEDMAYVPLITQKAVINITGYNSSLITDDKTTLVSAINELKTQFDGLVNLDEVSF